MIIKVKHTKKIIRSQKTNPKINPGLIFYIVSRTGIEPVTYSLRGSCSAS